VSSGTPTIYLAGDSTCQIYYAPNASDQQGWGQRFQEFFNVSDVIVVNKAIGGRSSKSLIDEGHLTEILAVIKPGDYLFAQWGINDRYTSDAARYANPATTFRTYLKQYIDGARGKNATPVLLTPTPRHQLSNGLPTNGFPEYCAAIIAVGAETNTPVIDLQSMALAYYTKVGDAQTSTRPEPRSWAMQTGPESGGESTRASVVLVLLRRPGPMPGNRCKVSMRLRFRSRIAAGSGELLSCGRTSTHIPITALSPESLPRHVMAWRPQAVAAASVFEEVRNSRAAADVHAIAAKLLPRPRVESRPETC
jgi:lysophospholipase L1-like esterase